ncbi:MAG: glycosyltransferase family 4 protein, partial [Saprospiraceae bacterium]
MKIGYILGLKQGIHRFIYRELCAMEEMGCDISIFTTKRNEGTYNPHDNWKVQSVSKWSGIFMQVIYFLKQPALYLKLLSEAIKNDSVADFAIAANYASDAKGLDLIHAHFGDRKLYVAYFLKRFTGIPLTVTIHAHELWRNPNWKMFAVAMAGTDKIVTISDFNKQYMIDNFQIDANKIEVVKLYVDDDDIIKDNQKHILIVGSYEERKGYDTLLEAMALMKRDDYTVWSAGYGHMDIPGMAKRLGLEERIKFFGKIHADILNILTMSCDFFCLPSKDVEMPG